MYGKQMLTKLGYTDGQCDTINIAYIHGSVMGYYSFIVGIPSGPEHDLQSLVFVLISIHRSSISISIIGVATRKSWIYMDLHGFTWIYMDLP